MIPDIRLRLLLVLWLFSRPSIGNPEDGQEPDNVHWQSKCQPITSPFCRDIEYNKTVFPNLLRHQTQKEASEAILHYSVALKAKCSPDIRFFLCSVFFPLCTEMPDPLPPCKSLCLSVWNGCKGILQEFNFKWPEELDCNKFADTQLCMRKNESLPNVDYASDTATTGPEAGISGKDFAFTCPDQFRVPKGFEDSLRVGQVTAKNCGLPCDNMFFGQDERRLSRIWVGAWAIVCSISCLFTVLTFTLNTSRFRYPERPIIFLSVCYLVVSVIYVIGFVSGDRVACRPPFPSEKRLQTAPTIVQGTKSAPCTIMFIGLYFFTMASSLWWVILALTWFLAAGLKWSHEAIEANSQYFHLAAWAIPAIKTISILALGKIEGDVLTGVCYVGLWDPDIARAFMLAPLLVYLVFGTIFLMLGFVSLFHIRTAMKRDGTKTDKLEKLMLRIGVFSVLYTLPAVTVIVCLIYEQMNFDHWMVTWHRRICHASSVNPYLIRCPSDGLDRKPNFYIFMLKYLSSLIVGVTSCVWIASHKTLASWKELIAKIFGQHGQTYV